MRSVLCVACGIVLLFSGTASALELRVNPQTLRPKQKAVVLAKKAGLPPEAGSVEFRVVDGEECGTLEKQGAPIAEGVARTTYVANPLVENCRATIRATLEGTTATASVRVNPPPVLVTKLDGLSIIALILVASFAIDRIVRGLLFVLSYVPRWVRLVPDPNDPDTPFARRRHFQLAYFCLAAFLGIIVLAWYGGVRVLAAMGFAGVHPVLDTLITGLILVAGAERTESLLRTLGAEGPAAPPEQDTTPIQIIGTLVLDGDRQEDRSAPGTEKGASAGAQSSAT